MADRWRDDSEFRTYLTLTLLPAYNPRAERIETVAARMGWTPVRLYKLLEGDINLIPEDIIALSIATGKPEIIEWLINKIPGLSLKRCDRIVINGSVDDELSGIHKTIGSMYEVLDDAMEDGRVDNREKNRLFEVTRRIREYCDSFDEEIKHMENGS